MQVSLGSQADDVKFILYDPKDKFHQPRKFEAVEFEFDLTYPESFRSDKSVDDSIVGFDIKMQRIISSFIFKCYLPCIAIVVASSISFIVPLSALPGRIALMVTQFLTLTNIFIHQIVSNSIFYINIVVCIKIIIYYVSY